MHRNDDQVQKNLTDHIVVTRQMAKDDILNTRKELELAFRNHETIHDVVDNNLAEFKLYVREQIRLMQVSLDRMREDRSTFLPRDIYDTAHEALEKDVLALEKRITDKHETAISQLIEKNDLALTQATDSLAAKISTNGDRITKIEQGIQVMNARNQQSIIALGALLTAVEILIRFFTQ
jgi:hypothetical protein